MNVLCVSTAARVLRFEPLLRLLTAREHAVHVVCGSHEAPDTTEAIASLRRKCPGIRWSEPPPVPFTAWSFFGLELQRALDFLREPQAEGAPDLIRALVRRPVVESIPGRWLLGRALQWCDRAVPCDPAIDAFLRGLHPDLVLVTADPESGSADADWIRSARALGMRTVRLVEIDDAAAARFVASLDIGDRSDGRNRPAWWGPLVRPMLARAADRVARSERARTEKRARQERLRQQRYADAAARRAELIEAKRHAEAERARRRQEADRLQAEERRSLDAIAARAYEHYRQVREWARRMRDAGDDTAETLTDYERQVVASLASLWDAGPETIACLRQVCEPVSGVRVSDYDAESSELTQRLKRELSMLRRHRGSELFVQESPALGGFGYAKKGELYNADTLKFFNALIALQDAAILPVFRQATARRVVWEIGGGWGGFAYQFKTLCPNVTYIVSSPPDRFLVSAVYLMAMFPAARCRFYEEAAADDLWSDWQNVDFIFVPESALSALHPPRVDLVVDLMALRYMSARRVCVHLQRAYEIGTPYVYSLAPSSPPNADTARVAHAIERLYWPHPIPPRGEVDPAALAADPGAMPPSDYAHLVGWRRLRR